MSLSAGNRLGPYEILALLDAGGVGEVYRARDTRDGREVAVKVFPGPRRFEPLDHPHIGTVYDVGLNYVAMEWIDGVSLKGPLSLQETLRFAAEICDALDYGHQRGIAHGDLKPSNILVTQQGVKLLNFGPTKAGDASADIDAFGGVLYEMLMGRPITADRRPVQPDPLEKVLQKCLEPDPAKRWQSVADLKQALAAVSKGGGYRREYIFAGAAVLMLILGLALLVMQFPSNQRLSDKDVLVLADFTNTTRDAIFDYTLRTALLFQLEPSPFLKIMDDEKVQRNLKLAGRPANTRITNLIAHEICVREGQKAMLGGAIADLGKTFSVTVQATNCRTGATLARDQVQAEGRDQVLNAISQAATSIRIKLGEPPSLAERQQVATASIAALQSYTFGIAQRHLGNNPASIAFFRHALELDPNFAIAYLQFGRACAIAGDSARAKEAYQRFFAASKDPTGNSPTLIQAKKEYSAIK